MPIAPDVFARFYAAINTEWPQFGLGGAEAEVQEKRWRRAFGDFDQASLGYALDQWLATNKKRPHVSDLIELAVAHSRGRLKGGVKLEVHWTRCSCGCGGQRWLKLLRDPATGKLRMYAATVAELTQAMPNFLLRDSFATVKDQLETLVSSPMTRVMQECKKSGNMPLPPLHQRVGFDAGEVPVYDVPSRPALGGQHA